jgi:hypothetical protein
MVTIDIPYIHCYVKGSYVSNQSEPIECYVFAATGIINRPLLFTCHTKSGAVFSRLPASAFTTNPDYKGIEYTAEELSPWGCISNTITVVKHTYLKDYKVYIPSLKCNGYYLMTFDQFNGGFSEDPEQHKTMNMIELVNGQFALMPNNYCRFTDLHFTKEDDIQYKRQSTYWTTD